MTDSNGEAPEWGMVLAVSQEDDELTEVPIDEDGTGSFELPAGEYEFVTAAMGDAGDLVGGLLGETIDEDNTEFVFDGTESFQLDSAVAGTDTEMVFTSAEIGFENPTTGVQLLAEVLPGGEFHMLPVEAGEGDLDRYVNYKPTLQDTANDDSAYHLIFEESEGISDDLNYEVSADELAEVSTRYGSLGNDTSGTVGLCGATERTMLLLCGGIESEFPSERTDYLMPGEEFFWDDLALLGEDFETGVTVSEILGPVEAEPLEREMIHTPLSLSLSNGVVVRYGDPEFGEAFDFSFSPMNNGLEEEAIFSEAQAESVTLTRDGEVIDSVDDLWGTIELPEDDSGRYHFTVESESDVTPLASQTLGTWEFDSESVEEFEYLNLSSLEFVADGLVDGFAPADEPLDFSMMYAPQSQAEEVALEEVSVEVSYDDGDTWATVDVDVDGNEVTGTLDHEDDAEYVSVRTEAADADGNVVTQETIRSFGLQ